MAKSAATADLPTGIPVTIRHIFVVKPLLAIAILVCLGALVMLFRLYRRQPRTASDRFLIAFVGLLSAYEGLGVLKEAGVVAMPASTVLSDAIELLVATSCLAATVMLRISKTNELDIESAIRLARAAPPRTTRGDLPLPKDAMLDALSWALPRVSDSAFKMLAVLCLRADGAAGSDHLADVRLRTGKTVEEVDRCLRELEDAGAVLVHRAGAATMVEVIVQSRRIVHSPAEPAVALVTESRV